MPIPIRYTTTNVSNSVRLGNIALGVNTVEYGPSSTTSWAGGVSVSSDTYDGEYAIHYLSGTTPRVRKADTFTLTTVAGQILGTSTYASTPLALSALAAAGCTVINTVAPPNIVISGSVFNSDSGLIMSYPRINTTWYDISGNANNSTLTNGPTFDNTSNSLVFDGTNDYVNGPAISSQLTGDMTAEGWFKVTAGSGDWVRVIGTGGNSGNRTFGLWYLSTSNYILWQRLGGSDPAILITQPLTNGKWYYFAATTIGSSHVLYLNNQVMGTATAAGPWAASGENITMGYAGFHAYINGNISRGRLYTRGLSSSEIAQNYYQGNIVTGSISGSYDAGNLVSFVPGTTVTYNMSANIISGSLQNGVGFNVANGGSWVFDGSDDRILLEGSTTSAWTLPSNTNWTVNVWVKTTTTANGLGQGSIFSNSSGGPVYSMMGINAGVMTYWHYNNTWLQSSGTTTVNNGSWHMLTWVNNDNQTMNLYVDGNLDASGVDSSLSGGSVNYLDIIGASWAAYFQGNIASLQINKGKAFTLSEVQQNFNAQRNRFNI